MEWTLTNFVVQIVAGFLGAHGAASVAHEHKFGFLGHSLVGMVCGALSGYFLQIMLITVVTGSGSVMAPRAADVLVTQALAGAGRSDWDVRGRFCDATEFIEKRRLR